MGYATTTLCIQNPIIPPPQNKNDWVHSVIFEPQPKIQLTQSSYKVTSFLDFQPFLQCFQSVNEYLNDLIIDIGNPPYFQRLTSPFDDVQITPVSNEMAIWKFLNSPGCKVHPYACQSKMKFEQYQLEIQYILKFFCAVHKKFLTAIDHIDYHSLQEHNANATRMKRSEMYNLYGYYCTQTQILTPSEENFLDEFMKALYKINPSLHKNLTCIKRVGILTWILGWEVYSNARSISKIKNKLHTLQNRTNCKTNKLNN